METVCLRQLGAAGRMLNAVWLGYLQVPILRARDGPLSEFQDSETPPCEKVRKLHGPAHRFPSTLRF